MTSLDHAELSTVLAALRFYQSRGLGEPANRPGDIHEIATDGGTVMASLDDEGIDSLCERLNVVDCEVQPPPSANDRLRTLGERELATILASLRLWQSLDQLPAEHLALTTDDGAFDFLANEDIDTLCERLNAPPMDPLHTLLVEFDSRFGDSVQDDLDIDGGDAVEWISEFAPQVREVLSLCAAGRQQAALGPRYAWTPVASPPDVSGDKFDWRHQSVPVLVKDAAGRVCVGLYAVDPDGEDPPRWVEDGRDGYEIDRPISWRMIPEGGSSRPE